MIFSATFNNMSVISWRSVLLVEEIRVLFQNHRLVASHWQTLSHNEFISPWAGFELTALVMIGIGCTGSSIYNCHNTNYHTITLWLSCLTPLSTIFQLYRGGTRLRRIRFIDIKYLWLFMKINSLIWNILIRYDLCVFLFIQPTLNLFQTILTGGMCNNEKVSTGFNLRTMI
jgi:hypothetical protein